MNSSFGKFYGQVQQRIEVAGVGLTETAYQAHVRLPLHAHNAPYFCFVVDGNYTETYGQRQRLCGPRMLVVHPAGESHSNRFGKAGGLCLNLEFSLAWEKRISEISPVFAGTQRSRFPHGEEPPAVAARALFDGRPRALSD